MGLLSSSSSKSSVSTETKDNRQVLDGGALGITDAGPVAMSAPAINISAYKGSASVQILDGGVIAETFDFLEKMLIQTTTMVDSLNERTTDIQETQGAQLAAAYTDAKGQKDILIVGALLVGGIALLFFLRK